ncbi:MAG TPA: glucans biosynthesis glucosyltransferase MdoH [Nevskiaceae bacterium]|nr:glucans biosynthesis glucosyltransferase MdoH [Nevskiaceae bacterium]
MDPKIALRARLESYLQHLPLTETRRSALRVRLEPAIARNDTALLFAELHRALADAAQADRENPPRQSLPARLDMALADEHKRGDEHAGESFTTDVQGQARLVTTPPLARASMRPTPWANNPFKRLAHWLRDRTIGRRGMEPHAPAAAADDDAPTSARRRPVRWRTAGRNRRFLLLALILLQTYLATYFMTAVLPYHGAHILEKAILVIYVILFSWVGAGFWTAMMGFWVLLLGRDKYSINASAAPDLPIDAATRTALLIPICNEDVARVYAGLRATYDSVMRAGGRQHFDFYILSDTNNADTRVAELEAWLQLCREVDGFGHIHYRRRRHRIKRKSGNIADWCRRWGSRYQYMVILDADSVMSGACLKRLVQLMEANPTAGIIQTAPRAAGRETLYSRIQQFATRAYGPLFTAGLHYWQLGESHYWGHNAIIRVAPFMRHCALGRLPGRGALSGEIMSHDFVEAALMRRAGWAVWIAYDLPGSYEEMPPTLLDELRRDQRWCQGNLQNFRLFMTRGLHPAHRAVFMTGVMAYISAPLWFAFLALSTALLWVQTKTEPVYFTQPYQLFPTWPEWHPEWAKHLFAATAGLLFLPKILATLLLLAQRAQLRLFGGPAKLVITLLLEMIFSALLAPVRMLFHTRYVTFALAGIAVAWKSPPREDAQTPWSEALRRHAGGTVLGMAWLGFVYWLQPTFLWWLLPVAGAMVIAIPLSVWSSYIGLGRWSRDARLFLIPEEAQPPRELRWTRAGVRRARDWSGGFVRAVHDPITNALVCAAAHPRERLPESDKQKRRELVSSALDTGLGKLSDVQRNALLSDRDGLALMHHKVWTAREFDAG